MPIKTEELSGMTCEVVKVAGANGDQIKAYVARPQTSNPVGTVVLINHAPGWDEWYWEATRRFAQHGFAAICPNLYERNGDGTPEEVGARVREAGGVPDEQVVGDVKGAADYMRGQSYTNGKTAVFGSCSGGRHAFLAAGKLGKEVDAVVECWPGGVIQQDADLTPMRPVSPSSLTNDVTASILGLFGNEDRNPTPEMANEHEAQLKAAGKDYEFHRYDGAGHGFFYYDRGAYRQEQAVDGWNKIWDWLPGKIG